MIAQAILKINPNAVVTVRGDDINTCEIEWHNGTTPISKADIEAKMVEVQAEYDANQYQRDRIYPSIGDENIKLLLNNPRIIPEHTDINKEIDSWIEVKEKNYSKLQHLLSYLPQEKKSDGKPI
jgi:hypothetical protein